MYSALGAECITENSYSELHKQTIQSVSYTSDPMDTRAYLTEEWQVAASARENLKIMGGAYGFLL